MKKTAIIIPARYGSSRLEGKPLLEVNGKPIIQWVYETAKTVSTSDEVIVATDDERIFNAVKLFGGEAEMTSTEHKCGSDRIKEVMVKNPEQLDSILNAVFKPVNKNTIDNVYRCAAWLLYCGIKKTDLSSIKAEHIDVKNCRINYE